MVFPRSLVALVLSLSVAAVIASPATETRADQILTGRQNGLAGRGEGGGGDPTGPSNPGPSQRSSSRRNLHRALDALSASEIASEICPENLYGCPIADSGSLSSLPSSFSDWISGGFECVDVTADLEACGGCASLDSKHDCTLIAGAESVSCVSGVCVVDSCLPSYKVDSDKSTCISK